MTEEKNKVTEVITSKGVVNVPVEVPEEVVEPVAPTMIKEEERRPVTEEQYNEILEALKDKIPVLTEEIVDQKIKEIIIHTKEMNAKQGMSLADPALVMYLDLIAEVGKLINTEVAAGNPDILKKYLTGDLLLFKAADMPYCGHIAKTYIDLIQKYGFVSHKVLEFMINTETANPAAAKLIAAQMLITKVLNTITKDFIASHKSIII